MIEIEVQNETHQTQTRIRFAAVPRIGEGIRLREPDGMWASYDVLDVWYQKAEFGDVWMPYLHVRMTPGEGGGEGGSYEPGLEEYETGFGQGVAQHGGQHGGQRGVAHAGELEPFKI